MMDKCEIEERLLQLAADHSLPFCYSCYRTAPTGRCVTCRSDDLMREVPGVGVEYGLSWVRDHLVEENLDPIDLDAAFEESIDELYPDPVKIGWIEVDVTTAIKRLSPADWEIAQDEWVDRNLEEDVFMSFDHGSTCYWTYDVEKFVNAH
jgi:hypothetical protein